MHTPGPWEYRASMMNNSFVIYPDYKPLATGSITIASTGIWDVSFGEECEANARLIAAAPDLLITCKYYRDLLNSMKPRPDLTIAFVETAIAKAEGRKD